MSKMLTEIQRVVDEDVSNRVTQYDVIYEAITNSIHAGAKKISCFLTNHDEPLPDEQLHNYSKVDEIKIIDNGKGFNDENYNSFCRYRSGFKKDIGGKGVGRFTFLKIYKKAKFKSMLIDNQEERVFTFDLDFDTDNINIKPAKVKQNSTEALFAGLTKQYYNLKRHVDRRIELNLEQIREKVLINLVPTLFFYKKKGTEILIEFIDAKTDFTLHIDSDDIPDFKQINFPVVDRNGKMNNFIMHHQISKKEGTLYAYYCANNRTVCDFASKDLKINMPYGYSGFILIESNYLNKHVNNERNDFDIFPVKTDLFSTISWEMINNSLKPEIAEIIKSGIPETTKINSEKLKDIQEERPYLIEYIDENDIDMAGFLDKKQLIEKAKRKFDTAKENVLSHSGKEVYSDEDLTEAIQLTQNELVSYVFDRVQVIERLKKMIEKNEKVESIIHNLFMKRFTEDEYFSVKNNNLWLLDDRYISYSYAASDKKIKAILTKLDAYEGNEINEDDKPDLSLFFSHSPYKKKGLKSVLIEIKPFDNDTKSSKKKFAGIQQLLDYADAFKEKEKIEEVWAFLITDVDSSLSNRLIRDGYNRLFSTDSPIYHRIYENGVSIYIVSARTLISDAEARNKVFLEIIKKQSKLSRIIHNIFEEVN